MASKTETTLPPPFWRNIIPTGFSSLRWLWKGWPLVQRFSDGEIIELKMIIIIIISCLTGEVGHMFKFDTCWYLELVWDLDRLRSLSGCYRRQAKANPSIGISADKHKRSLQSSSAAHLKTHSLASLGQKVLMDLVIYIITAKMGYRLKRGGGGGGCRVTSLYLLRIVLMLDLLYQLKNSPENAGIV